MTPTIARRVFGALLAVAAYWLPGPVAAWLLYACWCELRDFDNIMRKPVVYAPTGFGSVGQPPTKH